MAHMIGTVRTYRLCREPAASVYRQPQGGALLVVYNTTREPQRVELSVDWARLKSLGGPGASGRGELAVTDAYTKAPVPVSDTGLELEVPALNYRLLWIE